MGEGLVWKDKPQVEAKPGPSTENTQVKQPVPTEDPRQIKEPEPDRMGESPSLDRCATATNVEADIAPTPDIPPTPVPSFPPNRDDIPQTPLLNLAGHGEAPDRPPPTPTFHPPPGEALLQKRPVDMTNLPTPFGKTIPPLPFKLSGTGGRLPPVGGQVPNLDNLPSPPNDELPTYEEVEMADRLSGRKPKKTKSKVALEPL